VRLFSYVVRYDVGFAPNPFYGVCSLATCKPQIRKAARVNDWVIGTGSKPDGLAGRLVYAMHVAEILTFDDYWSDPRFAAKRPSMRGGLAGTVGDNIYHRAGDGSWVQERSRHTEPDGTPEPKHLEIDTSTNAVLVATRFSYFGAFGPEIPAYLRHDSDQDLVHKWSGHRSQFGAERVLAADEWLSGLPSGRHHLPAGLRSAQLA
jgi:hypothetical protein